MFSFESTKNKILAGIVGGAVLIGGGTAVVLGSTGVASAATVAPSSHVAHHADRHHSRSLLRRADHATAEVKVKGQWVTMTMNKGRVASVSGSSITLTRPDGQSAKIALGPKTRYRGAAKSETALRPGETARVVSEGGVARVVVSHHPKDHKASTTKKPKPATTSPAAG